MTGLTTRTDAMGGSGGELKTCGRLCILPLAATGTQAGSDMTRELLAGTGAVMQVKGVFMDIINEVGLRKLGWKLMQSKLDQDGKMIHLVQPASGPPSVAMLVGDTEDLIAGRTTLFDINELDRGARMKKPWPLR